MAGTFLQIRLRNMSATWHDTEGKWRNFALRLTMRRARRGVRPLRNSTLEVTPQPVQQNVAHAISKKQIILELKLARGLERAGMDEIRAIQADLRERLGPRDKTSASYIANILRADGVGVTYNDRYVGPVLPEPYARRLDGLLQFRDFTDAESALHKLDDAYREYRSASDRMGTSFVRTLVIKGRQRAESMARNPRVGAEKRQEKEEIARWFKVWLDLPDLFFDWLEMRKRSEEFQQMFSNENGSSGSEIQKT